MAGFRSGWVAISGPKHKAQSYIEGLDILANMRLCANVPSQHAIQTALGGYQSICLLYTSTALDHRDAFGLLDGGQPMRDHQRGATAHQRRERLLDQVFALGIQGAGGLV